jgi:hypothetical protein
MIDLWKVGRQRFATELREMHLSGWSADSLNIFECPVHPDQVIWTYAVTWLVVTTLATLKTSLLAFFVVPSAADI